MGQKETTDLLSGQIETEKIIRSYLSEINEIKRKHKTIRKGERRIKGGQDRTECGQVPQGAIWN